MLNFKNVRNLINFDVRNLINFENVRNLINFENPV